MVWFGLLVIGLNLANPLKPSEVLNDRTVFARMTPKKEWATLRLFESGAGDKLGGIYGLSAITVPAAGWHVDAVTIFTTARNPEKWEARPRPRLNVLPKHKDDVEARQ